MPTDGIIYESFEMCTPVGDAISGKNLLEMWDPFSAVFWVSVSNEELSKVFERLYKVDKSRSIDAKGTGLGLYIVKMMVEMHAGKIWALSEDDSSAEFVFRLPKSYRPIYKKEIK